MLKGKAVNPDDASDSRTERVLEQAEDVENFLPILINRLSDGITKSFSKTAAHFDLSLVECRVLRRLTPRDGLRLNDLAKASGVNLSTLCRLIRRLERKDLVAMTFRGGTGRADTVRLTPRGASTLADLRVFSEAHEKSLVTNISESELETCKSVLNRVQANVHDEWLKGVDLRRLKKED